MHIRTTVTIVFAAAAALSLAACEGANEPAIGAPVADATAVAEPAPTDPTATVPAGAVDASRVVDRAPVAGAAPGFDVRAFAGTFATQGANLQLGADGTYSFTVHAESADADLVTTGTWTIEADGTRLLLDPDSKDDPDQRFTIASSDELVAVDGGRVLSRDGA